MREMDHSIDSSRGKIFLRQLIIASKKHYERNKSKKDIEQHIEKIKNISQEKTDVLNELDLLKEKIKRNVYKEKSGKIRLDSSKKKIEALEKKIAGYHKKIKKLPKTKKAEKEITKQHIKKLEEMLNKIKKKYPKKDVKKIEERITSLKKRL